MLPDLPIAQTSNRRLQQDVSSNSLESTVTKTQFKSKQQNRTVLGVSASIDVLNTGRMNLNLLSSMDSKKNQFLPSLKKKLTQDQFDDPYS